MQKLAAGQDGDVEVVVVQVGDTPNDYVFVRSDRCIEVTELLAAWGISDETVMGDRNYAALGVVALEKLFELDASSV